MDGETWEMIMAWKRSRGREKKWICPVVREDARKWQAGQAQSVLTVFSVCKKLIHREIKRNPTRKARFRILLSFPIMALLL
ncbi:MAG: hypothetical protein WCB96_14570 [Candidatus Aminicenantales bacterium]